MSEALRSTGRAVFLSAVTTIIGFISLTFTPMAPIQTVGWGSCIRYRSCLHHDDAHGPQSHNASRFEETQSPPPRLFKAAVSEPVNFW